MSNEATIETLDTTNDTIAESAPVETTSATTVDEGATQTIVAPSSKSKNKAPVDLFVSIGSEIENLTQAKAIKLADSLVEDIDVTYFRLGGVLKKIFDNNWIEGYSSTGDFVKSKYNFAERKARYLIQIYVDLTDKQIPFAKVGHLGWTKLKTISAKLTLENVDEWVAKAEKLTVQELEALLSEKTETGEVSTKTTDAIVTMKFKLHTDQVEIVQSALAKAKGDLNTEFDSTALEAICSQSMGAAPLQGLGFEEIVQKMGFQSALKAISDMFPEYDINVQPVAATPATTEAPAEPATL